MSHVQLLKEVGQAARDHEASEHRLRLAVTAARAAEVPIASIAKAAGVTRQTVYNWSTDYGQGFALTVVPGAHLEDLPVQRPRAVKRAPVLILGTRSRGRLKWNGHRGKAAGYAGDRLGVSVPSKIVDVIAESWALAGDSFGAGRRPRTGDRVICEDGVLATVEDASGETGDIQVVAGGKLRAESWWAIVLPGI